MRKRSLPPLPVPLYNPGLYAELGCFSFDLFAQVPLQADLVWQKYSNWYYLLTLRG